MFIRNSLYPRPGIFFSSFLFPISHFLLYVISMKQVAVVAGNHRQFLQYVRDHYNSKSAVYTEVVDADRLRGLRDYKLVFYGTWVDRRDLDEIKAIHNGNMLAEGRHDEIW